MKILENLKSAAQKMAELLHNYVIFGGHFVFDFFHNLLRYSLQSSMQNRESVAQKMAELLHNYVIIT